MGAERLALLGWQSAHALVTASSGVGDVNLYLVSKLPGELAGVAWLLLGASGAGHVKCVGAGFSG